MMVEPTVTDLLKKVEDRYELVAITSKRARQIEAETLEKRKIAKQALKDAKINFSISNHRTVKQFNIFKNNTELLSILSDAGLYAHGKRMPKVVFSWDKESVSALLDGLFDADGYYDINDKKKPVDKTGNTNGREDLHMEYFRKL